MTDKFLRLPTVRDLTGLSRSTIYARISNDQFPKPLHLGERCVAWLSSEIDTWMQEQIQKNRDPQDV